MTFRFLRKRWSSGSSEKFQYELDKNKSNKNVLRFEDKQTVTYVASANMGTLPPGVAKANHPLSSSVPLSYFEVFIVSAGKEGASTSTIAVGLAPLDLATDMFPGWLKGSYGYHGDDGRKYSGLQSGTGDLYGPTFTTGDVIGVGLDNATNHIFFTKNGRYLGTAFKRTGVHDLYPCVGLHSPGETAFVNFTPPFVFDQSILSGVGTGGGAASASTEDMKGKGYEDLHWDPARCGKSLEVTSKIRARVLDDSPHSVIGVVQCSLPFSPYHAETFSYFEVLIERLEKGHVSIGLSNHEYPLNLHIGWLKRSYGYHSDDGRKFKWKEHESGTNDGELYGPAFGQGDTIGCGLNLQTRELYFTKNGSYLGVAFMNVYGILYPSIALTGPGDSLVGNFYPPFKYTLFTNSLVNLNTTSMPLNGPPIPAPPPLPGHSLLSISAPAIRNSNAISQSAGTSPTISESPPRSNSFLGPSSAHKDNTSPYSTRDQHSSILNNQRSPQTSHALMSSSSAPSLSTSSSSASSSSSSSIAIPSSIQTSPASLISSSPSTQRTTTLAMSKSTPAFSANNNPIISISASLMTRSQPPSTTSSQPNSNQPPTQHALLALSGSQLSSTSSAGSPSPPVSPRTALSASNSSVSDEPHAPPSSSSSSSSQPLSAPSSSSALSSSGGTGGSGGVTSGMEWRKNGKTIKLKDEITATLAKRKTGVVQGALACTATQRLWYFEVYLEGLDKRASVCIGLTSEDYSLSKHVGREPRSYGYHSEEGRKWKNGEVNMDLYGSPYMSGDVVGCGINTVTREIFFTKNGVYLGVAFWDVPDIPLYPSVSLRGAVGLTCVATFHSPFKFDLHLLPDISPSMWSESLGDPMLNEEQVLYPPTSSSNNSRLAQQQHQQNWDPAGGPGGTREQRGIQSWTANDVAIWLESIGYAQYRKQFYANNISGRHLSSLSHLLLKKELGIESYGNRADLLDRVTKLQTTWKEKAAGVSDVDTTGSSSIMDLTGEYTTSGSEVSDYPGYQDHGSGSLLDVTHANSSLNEEVLLPYRTTTVHHARFSDPDNSEDEGRTVVRTRNRNSSVGGPGPNGNPILNGASNSSNPSLLNPPPSANPDRDGRWRRRTVPCPDVDVDIRPPVTAPASAPMPPHHPHSQPPLPRPSPIPSPSPSPLPSSNPPPIIPNRPRTNTGNAHTLLPLLPLPNTSNTGNGAQPQLDVNDPFSRLTLQEHFSPVTSPVPPPGSSSSSSLSAKPKPSSGGFSTFSHLNSSSIPSSPPVVREREISPRGSGSSLGPSPVSHLSNSLTNLPSFTPSTSVSLPASLQHSPSNPSIITPSSFSTTPPKGRAPSPAPPFKSSPLPLTSSDSSLLPSTTSSSSSLSQNRPSPAQTATPSSAQTSSLGKGSSSSTQVSSSGSGVSPTKSSGEVLSPPPPERHEWEIDFNELELGPVIGKGFFGEVKRGSWRETDVAIKIIYRDSFKSKNSFDMFMNEVQILSKLRHPCVVQFLGACTTGDHHCIVTEWMAGGSLRSFLTAHFHMITPAVRIKIGLDIAKGMNYLHGWTPPILHRDLSSRNILLDVDGCWTNTSTTAAPPRPTSVRCKVADFGLSRLKLEHGVMTASVGCIPYMAPEVYKGEANSEKSDVYSYGMILWEVISGEEPHQDMKPLKMAHLAAHEGYRPPMPPATPTGWRLLITSCWTEDPDARPSFRQIIGSFREMEEQDRILAASAPLPSPIPSPSPSPSSQHQQLPQGVPLQVFLSTSTPTILPSAFHPTPITSPTQNAGEYLD